MADHSLLSINASSSASTFDNDVSAVQEESELLLPPYSDQPSSSSRPQRAPDPSQLTKKPDGVLPPPPFAALPSELELGLGPSSQEPDQPPEFSVYRASYTTDSLGNITSHDPHLNSDGEALCRFILLHITSPPGLVVKLSGTHDDWRRETITEYVNGRTEYRTREERQTITDFSFTLSVASEQDFDHGIRRLYIVNDGEVVSRGKHRRERAKWENGKDLSFLSQTDEDHVGLDLPGRETIRVRLRERRKADKIAHQVHQLGCPPFVPAWMFPENTFSCEPARPPEHLLGPEWRDRCSRFFNSIVKQGYYRHHKPNPQSCLKVERELRQWCDDYCANQRSLKELRVEKLVFGWNLALLEEEILKLLGSIPHLPSTHFSVDFYPTSSTITVRPVNWVSKIFSLSGFSKFLLTITLIYPILWLIRYLILGAEYDVVRAAYPLVYWHESDRPDASDHSKGRLQGQTELDWLAANRYKISQACLNSKMGIL